MGHENTTTIYRYVEANLALERPQEPHIEMERYSPRDDTPMKFLQAL